MAAFGNMICNKLFWGSKNAGAICPVYLHNPRSAGISARQRRKAPGSINLQGMLSYLSLNHTLSVRKGVRYISATSELRKVSLLQQAQAM